MVHRRCFGRGGAPAAAQVVLCRTARCPSARPPTVQCRRVQALYPTLGKGARAPHHLPRRAVQIPFERAAAAGRQVPPAPARKLGRTDAARHAFLHLLAAAQPPVHSHEQQGKGARVSASMAWPRCGIMHGGMVTELPLPAPVLIRPQILDPRVALTKRTSWHCCGSGRYCVGGLHPDPAWSLDARRSRNAQAMTCLRRPPSPRW